MTRRNAILLSGAAAALLVAAHQPAAHAAQAAPADIQPMSWASNGFDYDKAIVPNMADGVRQDPKYPYCVNGMGCTVQPRMGDEHSPLLQPWAQEIVVKWNKDVLSGKQGFVPQSRCWPANVPLVMVYSGNRYHLPVSRDEFMIITERGPNVRFIWLDQQHTANPAPTWLGETVGHYEGEDLVTDTIGIKVHPYSMVDHYRTPHTEKLHVVERFTVAADKMSMTDSAIVEDPGTFTMPWSVSKKYRASAVPISSMETICAENNDANYFGEEEVPIPQTAIPDF